MDRTRIGIILIKLGAAFMFINVLQDANMFLSYFEVVEDRWGLALFSVSMTLILPVIVIAVLWFFPATLLGKQASDATTAPPLDDAAGAILVGVSLVGLYALVFGVIDLFYYESIRWAEFNYANQLGYEQYSPSGGTVATRYTCILQIIIGLALLFGRRGLSAALASARGRGKAAS